MISLFIASHSSAKAATAEKRWTISGLVHIHKEEIASIEELDEYQNQKGVIVMIGLKNGQTFCVLTVRNELEDITGSARDDR